MSVSNNLEIIDNISAQLGVDAAFIEKDQFAMQLIADLAKINHPKIQLVFSGGTSLSKGHGLIQRFSEDLDFKISLKGEVTRKERRDFREQVIQTIGGNEQLNVDTENVKSGNSSRFFKMQVFYPQALPQSNALRNHIQLEVTFEEPTLPPENRPLKSFVAQAKGEEPEVQSIPCISPVETAADKLSALTWRVLDRDRTQPNDDATLVRHLHDLAALTKTVKASNQFEELALNSIEKDINRSKTINSENFSPIERLESMLQILQSDSLYKDEFTQFVVDLSYADEEDRPTFENSLNALEILVEGVKERYLSRQTIPAKTAQSKTNPQPDKVQQIWERYHKSLNIQDPGQRIQAIASQMFLDDINPETAKLVLLSDPVFQRMKTQPDKAQKMASQGIDRVWEEMDIQLNKVLKFAQKKATQKGTRVGDDQIFESKNYIIRQSSTSISIEVKDNRGVILTGNSEGISLNGFSREDLQRFDKWQQKSKGRQRPQSRRSRQSRDRDIDFER